MAKTYVIYKMYNAWVPFQKYYQKCKKKIRQKTSTVTDKQEIEKGGKTRLHPHKKKSFATSTQLPSILVTFVMMKTTIDKHENFIFLQ